MEIAVADQADKPVAQILALEQHENDDDDDQASRCQRADQRSDDVLQDLERSLSRDDLDGNRLAPGLVCRWRRHVLFVDLLTDTLDHPA
jgi:hypothetical protein